MAAAAQLSLTQLSSGNPVYEKYYKQMLGLKVEAGNTGRVLALDAAAFLKKSGLPDLILGKIWDLADTDGKGVLNKQEFFVALRLVACAQNGLEVSLNSLNLAVPPPRFHDSSSPLLTSGTSAAELPWAVKSEDKAKYDAIFDSLSPVDGFLSGDKVKPVLLNSKLPVEILGRVWELSDIDHDGKLDRDEFAVAMFLVYCALEKEPVPMSLPPALVPPSKRKTVSISGSMWVIPSSAAKDSYHSLPSVGISPTRAPLRQKKAKYDEIFLKTDKDMDGYVSGPEVRETFLKTGLPSALLARIWSLCDTKNCGKLSKDQFALAFHLINQKLIKGIDPPHILTPEMIPPSDRSSLQKNIIGSSPVADFSAIKELDTLNNEIVDLQREKNNVEQDLKEKEDTVKQRTGEVQGNLGRVEQVSDFEYDLFIRPDTCNPRFRVWFNFTVENVKELQRVIFNIVNFSKTKSLYRDGMAPMVKSTSRPKWQRLPPKNVYYYRCPDHRKNYVMSFAFCFDREDDIYQFAYCYPYTYTRFQHYLDSLQKKNMDYFFREQLGQSV
ncbi:Epidermal growth factor receptor substrate 15 [Apodemus speciosus]|uniref:Epidermal growth factor receptor substrate 15 n=1 Tax=Apodemus speciosus TaxID=105296 RepID=A0ABQ0EPH6_APOSI